MEVYMDIAIYEIEAMIKDIYDKKIQMIKNCKEIERLVDENKSLAESIDGYDPLQLNHRQYKHQDGYEKYIDRTCWYFLSNQFNLQKYMLCTEYKKMNQDIEDNKTPDFNPVNALGWVRQLKDLIYDNVKTLIEKVFADITEKVYYTGSGYSNEKKKKRNNNGIDKFFIITTYDYRRVFGYSCDPTITDDLEKCLYILNGKLVPEVPIKDTMRKNKIDTAENEYMKIKVCKNDNTHYWIKSEKVLNILNRIGSGESNLFGENIKIKIFEKQ